MYVFFDVCARYAPAPVEYAPEPYYVSGPPAGYGGGYERAPMGYSSDFGGFGGAYGMAASPPRYGFHALIHCALCFAAK